jgi:hypothetical protein
VKTKPGRMADRAGRAADRSTVAEITMNSGKVRPGLSHFQKSISFQTLRKASFVDRPRRYPKLASSNILDILQNGDQHLGTHDLKIAAVEVGVRVAVAAIVLAEPKGNVRGGLKYRNATRGNQKELIA